MQCGSMKTVGNCLEISESGLKTGLQVRFIISDTGRVPKLILVMGVVDGWKMLGYCVFNILNPQYKLKRFYVYEKYIKR